MMTAILSVWIYERLSPPLLNNNRAGLLATSYDVMVGILMPCTTPTPPVL